MNEKRLILNTKKSLYDPIEVEVDGQVYQSVKTTRATLEEINKLDEEIQKNPADNDVLYKAIQLLFDIKPEILDKLDKREVEDIYSFSKQKFFEIEKQRAEIIIKMLGKAYGLKKQKTKEAIPSQRRPGKKR